MDDRTLSRVVAGKSRKYLRTATAALLAALISLAGALTVVEAQAIQADSSFTDNPNVHVIEVTAQAQNIDRPLTFADAAAVAAAASVATEGHSTAIRLETGFGIPDDGGQDVFVVGIDGDAAERLGLPAMESGVAYRPGAEGGSVTLQIPVVRAANGGMVSDSAVPMTLPLRGGVRIDGPLFTLSRIGSDTLLVDGSTFHTIVSTSTGTPWSAVRAQYDSGTLDGWPLVRSVYVWVDALSEVRLVADRLDAEGWATSYTLRAFRDVEGSLGRTAFVGLGVTVVITLGSLLLSFLSLNTYLRLARRDMGLLRHMRYPVADVASVYRRRVNAVVGLALAVVASMTTIAGLLVLRAEPLYVAANVVAVAAMAAMVYLIVVRVMLPRRVNRPILELLALQREFE